ncbi:LPS assembly lipoprotein LptE [Hymenobacter sp. J193]|uniref:LptE family protein n=1 Tax=Hymenobacter sp. J193 TaxID=2898429 RepID=UPI0021507FB5|nr:LptE family protein [Hymenobacter sp. J193]MCR5889924.1 LPS assembly lipoprotein LptE [Hymenobacter sp. J193]
MIWNKFKSAICYGLLAVGVLFSVAGCKVYSFSGVITGGAKTMSIQTFSNNAANGPSSISQQFTEDFKDFFQRNTTLKLVPRDGDLQFEGAIISYDIAPAAIEKQDGRDQAGLNRLTIQVRVKYTNTLDSKQDFEQTFQSQEDFPGTQDASQINANQTKIREINRRIINDAFNKSVANW